MTMVLYAFVLKALCIFMHPLCHLSLCLSLLMSVFSTQSAAMLQRNCVQMQMACNAQQTLLALLQHKLWGLQLILLRSAHQHAYAADMYSQTRYIFSREEDSQGWDLCLFLSMWVSERDEVVQEKKDIQICDGIMIKMFWLNLATM